MYTEYTPELTPEQRRGHSYAQESNGVAATLKKVHNRNLNPLHRVATQSRWDRQGRCEAISACNCGLLSSMHAHKQATNKLGANAPRQHLPSIPAPKSLTPTHNHRASCNIAIMRCPHRMYAAHKPAMSLSALRALSIVAASCLTIWVNRSAGWSSALELSP